jgi:periplasmic glucans biosynthesis protein
VIAVSGNSGRENIAAAQSPFIDYTSLIALATQQAERAFSSDRMTLTAPFAELTQDSYNAITTRQDTPLLGAQSGSGKNAFALDLLPPGLVYSDPVKVSIVRDNGTSPAPFSPLWLNFDPAYFPAFPDGIAPAEMLNGLNYTGIRLKTALNRPDQLDEFAVFQGATFFRAIARGMTYGASARALAIGTGDPRGEEFPVFRQLWIKQPAPDAREVVVWALVDSPSCSAAYEFRIQPGQTTVMDVRCRLFPRSEIDKVGIAPLSSMFYFSPTDRGGIDDYRGAVHNSAGLQMITGTGQRLWRPLKNPGQVELSVFQDVNPTGFGLSQRPRNFSHYQDEVHQYEKRPSVWVEPLGNWGEGAVLLVEIPVQNELNNNIVAFWRPRRPLQPLATGHDFAYRLHWCNEPPDTSSLAQVSSTRTGSLGSDGRQRFAVDFTKPETPLANLAVRLSTSTGSVGPVSLSELPSGRRVRATFDFTPDGSPNAEMILTLREAEKNVSETWLYRWTQT